MPVSSVVYNFSIVSSAALNSSSASVDENCEYPDTRPVSLSTMSKYLEIALMHLYHKNLFEESFERIFLSFTERYKDYTHIEDRLCKDFLPDLLSLLEEYKPSSSSLGIRVKTLIETDIIKAMDQIEALKKNSDFCDTSEYHINKEIIHASSQYIVELEKIAQRTYDTGTYIYGW